MNIIRDAGGMTGDLFMVVRSKEDPRFERRGADLLHSETIALTDAVLGASLQAPTLDGQVSVTFPHGTQPGSVPGLKGKDLPEFSSKHYGDLYLRIEVHIPEKLSKEERELYERLRAINDK